MTTPAPRLRPTRAGVIGLWDYTDAVFHFADGRLVLRGANGSGKTKALEVLFPFVLDGRLDPRRLDPFSGENRTMKENLLWRGGTTGHGYAWLEFGQPAHDDHPARYVTVAVGLQGQRHLPSPRSWFLVTEGRIGHELVLVGADGRPRTRKELTETLGDNVVVERASEHRRRVDEALFGLGPERYEAMLDLVLTLRRPMLAKDLDPHSLSETLTRGLRPIDEDLIEQVARSFDDLEAVQRDLDRLVHADEATTAFVTDYRGYLRSQARHRADHAIAAVATRAAAEQRCTAAAQALAAADREVAAAQAELAATEQRLAEGRARRDALQASEAYRTAEQLSHLEQAVRDLDAEVRRAAQRAQRATVGRESAERELDQAVDDRRRADAEVARLLPRVRASADAAGVDWSDADTGAPTDTDAPPHDPSVLRQRIGARAAARQADLDAVGALLDRLLDAERRVEAADRARDDAQAAEAAAREQLDTADREVTEAREQLREQVGTWRSAHAAVVTAEDGAAVLDAVERIGDDGGPALGEVWQTRITPRRSAAAADRAAHTTALAALDEQAAALHERRRSIADERDDAPPPPSWRQADRHDRGGAPLWRLVRFADGLDPAQAAALEAGLEAAGLLDAWVHPDGAVGDDEHDTVLVPTTAVGSDARSLAQVLVPEQQDHVDPAVVAAVLACVPLDQRPDGEVVVTLDGRFRLGPLRGHHGVGAPRYVGATARARHRAQRLAALDAELAELGRERAQVRSLLDEVEAWLAAVDQATAALPPPTTLQAAQRRRDIAAGRHQQARTTLTQATAAAETARRAANDHRQALHHAARARSLPTDPDAIAEVAAALARFSSDGRELVAAVAAVRTQAGVQAGAERRADDARSAQAHARDDLTEREVRRDARQVELTTLTERMGADVQAVLAELRALEDELDGAEVARRGQQQRVTTTAAARGRAEGEVAAAEEARAAGDRQLQDAYRRLRPLARPDLAGPLGLVVGDHVDDQPLLETIDALVDGVSSAEERRKAAQTRITRSLETLDHALGSAYRPAWEVRDDLIVVTIADEVGTRSVAGFAAQLTDQRRDQETLLTARERAVFEDALLTAVCGQIHERTLATRDLVAAMDREMRARRLSSGQTVGVAWRADDTATADRRQVHRLLDQDPAHLGADQLELLRRHFGTAIKSARAEQPLTPYRELLAGVLDYRRWRRFELALVEADGTSAPLTRARHARLSGGEKAASLHLPLFAAAHAAFAAGAPTAPRLLALDEAFAGIDDQGRSELLSLSVVFDLDLFMTGYDLWAVDRAVPGVAHYDLLHLPDEHAVSSLLIVWNGEELIEGADAEQALAAAWSTA